MSSQTVTTLSRCRIVAGLGGAPFKLFASDEVSCSLCSRPANRVARCSYRSSAGRDWQNDFSPAGSLHRQFRSGQVSKKALPMITQMTIATAWSILRIIQNHNKLLETLNNFLNTIGPQISTVVEKQICETGAKLLKE